MGIDIEAARRGQGPGKFRCAQLLLNQPPGAAIWRELGGWKALDPTTFEIIQLRYQDELIAHAKAGGNGPRPKAPQEPVGLIEQRRQDKVRKNRAVTLGKAHKARLDNPEWREEQQRRMATWSENWAEGPAASIRRENTRRMNQWRTATE